MKTKTKFIKTSVLISTILHSNVLQASDRMECDLGNYKPFKMQCNSCRYDVEMLDMTDQKLFSIQAKRLLKRKLSDVTNDPKCVFDVAMTYYQGDYTISKNYNKARIFFEHQIHAKGMEGNYFLGQIYLNGCGVEKNEKKAFEYFKKVAESDNYYSHEGNYQLGLIYYKNMFSTPETHYLLREHSADHFQKAIKNGKHMDSVHHMGMIAYFSATDKDLDDWNKAHYLGASRAYFEVVAVEDQKAASYYQLGKIRDKEEKKYRSFSDSYNKTIGGLNTALNSLRFDYYWREQINFDKTTSFDFFKKSADLGYSEGASEVLGGYLNGKGALNKDEVNKYVIIEYLAKVTVFMMFCEENGIPKDLQRFIVSNLVTARLGTK